MNMIALVAYDISDHATRARLHGFLKEFGLNTQKSVFECEVDEEALTMIVKRARKEIDPRTDSVRIYRICESCSRKVQISGRGVKVLRLDFMVL